MSNWIVKKIKTVATIGCSESESEASNRVTIFTNVIVLLGLVLGAFVSIQLPSLGMPIKYLSGVFVLTILVPVVLGFNYKGRLIIARITTQFFGTLVGWNSMIIFGKTFNGYYIFWVCLIYSTLAFSKNKLQLRIPMIFLAIVNLPLVDWIYHANIPSISGLEARNFPFYILCVNTVLFAIFITCIIWIEKAKADRYEADLQTAMEDIQREKQKLQVVFDNVKQGIIPITTELNIDVNYSAHTNEIFKGEVIANRNIFDLLLKQSDLSEDQVSLVKTSLDFCLGEDGMNWDLNSDNLPKQLKVGEVADLKHLSLLWSPIIENDQVTSLILNIEDISDRVREKQNREEQHILEKITRSIIKAMTKAGFVQTTQLIDSLSAIKSDLCQGNHTNNPGKMLYDLHSAKGEARMLEMDELAEMIHRLESSLDKNPSETGISDDLISYVSKLEDFSKKLLDSSGDSGSSWSLFSYVANLQNKLFNQLENAQHPLTIKSIGVKDEICKWPSDLTKSIQTILLHSTQNSIDHGYIIPKNEQDIQIMISASETQESYLLEIEDFGVGINMEMIETKYNQLNPEQKNLLTQKTDLLFMDHFSTANEVTLSSGRGVGLSAVKAEVEERGGFLSLENSPDHTGTLMRVTLPKQKQRAAA